MSRRRFTRMIDTPVELPPPRIGRIRLGTRSEAGYPVKSDHFVCPPEVVAVAGPQPKRLVVAFTTENAEEILTESLRCYRETIGLWCIGNGREAERLNEGGGTLGVDCPCERFTGEKKSCRYVASFRFLLPDVSVGGIYQIDTGKTSFLNLLAALQHTEQTVGAYRLKPFFLDLVPKDFTLNGGKMKSFVLNLTFAPHTAQVAARQRFLSLRESWDGGPRYRLSAPEAELGSLDPVPCEATDDVPPPAHPGGEDGMEEYERTLADAEIDALAAAESGDLPPAEEARPPAASSGTQPSLEGAGLTVTGVVQDIGVKNGTTRKGKRESHWTRYAVQVEGEWYSTFDDNLGGAAVELKGYRCALTYKLEGSYRTLLDIGLAKP